MSIIKLNKLDCARRQMDIAIKMWFFDEEPVSSHTLACAAYEILKDINYNLKKTISMFDILKSFNGLVSPELERRLPTLIKLNQNYFKHADRDHNSELDFNTDQTHYFLLDGGLIYLALTNEMTIPMRINHLWFAVHNPETIQSGSEYEMKINKLKVSIISMSKPEFYENMINSQF